MTKLSCPLQFLALFMCQAIHTKQPCIILHLHYDSTIAFNVMALNILNGTVNNTDVEDAIKLHLDMHPKTVQVQPMTTDFKDILM